MWQPWNLLKYPMWLKSSGTNWMLGFASATPGAHVCTFSFPQRRQFSGDFWKPQVWLLLTLLTSALRAGHCTQVEIPKLSPSWPSQLLGLTFAYSVCPYSSNHHHHQLFPASACILLHLTLCHSYFKWNEHQRLLLWLILITPDPTMLLSHNTSYAQSSVVSDSLGPHGL